MEYKKDMDEDQLVWYKRIIIWCSYLIFVIFSPPTQFFTKFFSTQKRVNVKFLQIWQNFTFLHICCVEKLKFLSIPALGKSLGPRGVYFPIHPSSRQCTDSVFPWLIFSFYLHILRAGNQTYHDSLSLGPYGIQRLVFHLNLFTDTRVLSSQQTPFKHSTI